MADVPENAASEPDPDASYLFVLEALQSGQVVGVTKLNRRLNGGHPATPGKNTHTKTTGPLDIPTTTYP